MVSATVEVTYVVTRAAVRYLHQLLWPVSGSIGTEASPSFELVVLGSSGGASYQSLVYSPEGPEVMEALYEEVEAEGVYTEIGGTPEEDWSSDMEAVTRGSEDEGVYLEGDAGYAWEDTRWELWKWEAEQGMGEDESEGEDGEEDNDKDRDDDKDNPGLLPAEEEDEEGG